MFFCYNICSPCSAIDEFLDFRRKFCFVFRICWFLCSSQTHKLQNLCCHHRYYCILEFTLFYCFLWILYMIKMKVGKVLVELMTKVPNFFLVQFWRQETIPRPFLDFKKMPLLRDLLICSSWYSKMLTTSVILSKKLKPSNWSQLLIE